MNMSNANEARLSLAFSIAAMVLVVLFLAWSALGDAPWEASAGQAPQADVAQPEPVQVSKGEVCTAILRADALVFVQLGLQTAWEEARCGEFFVGIADWNGGD